MFGLGFHYEFERAHILLRDCLKTSLIDLGKFDYASEPAVDYRMKSKSPHSSRFCLALGINLVHGQEELNSPLQDLIISFGPVEYWSAVIFSNITENITFLLHEALF